MTNDSVPNHIGLIIDGNRRWAKKHGLPTYEGHLAGYNVLKDIVQVLFDKGVKYISVYSFSSENWKRNEDEVNKLMGLMLGALKSDLNIFENNNIKLLVTGTREGLSEKLVKAINEAELKTADNTAGTLSLCFNYGGQQEIVEAVKKIVQSGVSADGINEDLVRKNLYAPEMPQLDIVVRTGGEHRISNFMLWQIAYSELLFIDKFWPDMKKEDIDFMLDEFSKRQRRIGQ